MKREPTQEGREKIVRAIAAGGNPSNKHVYLYYRVRLDRGAEVYQGSHHLARIGES